MFLKRKVVHKPENVEIVCRFGLAYNLLYLSNKVYSRPLFRQANVHTSTKRENVVVLFISKYI